MQIAIARIKSKPNTLCVLSVIQFQIFSSILIDWFFEISIQKITQHKHYTNTMLHFTVDPSNLTPKKVKTQMGKKEIDEGRVAMNIVEVDGVHR